MERKAEGIEGLDEEYQQKLQELRRQQEELEREYELRKTLYIAANSKVSRTCVLFPHFFLAYRRGRLSIWPGSPRFG